jgi:hypothetical protein
MISIPHGDGKDRTTDGINSGSRSRSGSGSGSGNTLLRTSLSDELVSAYR